MKLHYPEPVRYRKPLPQARVDELGHGDWFSNITSPEQIAASALSSEWEDFTLERQNDLSSVVATRLQQQGSEWNKCARAFKSFFDEHLAPVITSKLKAAGLDDALLSVVAWDVVSYMQELNYADVRRPAFFQKLWQAYREGRFPCGWSGEYPKGELIVL